MRNGMILSITTIAAVTPNHRLAQIQSTLPKQR